MLSSEEIEERFVSLGIPEAGRQQIRLIRSEVPVRVAASGTMSNRTRYCSNKMGFVLDTEASHTEYPAVVVWDYDEETEEMYPQAAQLKISGARSDGKKFAFLYTPDFFRITVDSFEFVECKLESALLELARKYPTRYSLNSDGRWRSPPAEAAAAALGCKFTIRSSAENNWILIENLEFLRDYMVKQPKINSSGLKILTQRLEEKYWCSIDELINDEPRVDADVLYSAICRNEVYFDQTKYRLTETKSSGVFRNKEAAIAYGTFVASKTESHFKNTQLSMLPGTRFEWDGKSWEVLNFGKTKIAARQLDSNITKDSGTIDLTHELVSSLAREGKIIPIGHPSADPPTENLLVQFSPDQLQEAVWRHEVLFGQPSLKNPFLTVSIRTLQLWKANWRAAELSTEYGFFGLIRNASKSQGNKNRKLADGVIKIMGELLDQEWSNPTRKTLTNIYGQIIIRCKAMGFHPPSRRTFILEEKSRRTQKKLVQRLGRRAAYEEEAIQHWWLEYTTPTHGTHPFHFGHIDSTPLDLKLRDRTNKHLVKTLWLTVLLDAYSRKVLAFYLSFDHPSFRSNMMVIRDCVRRHGRLPQLIVSDWGPEFQSVYYETLLATFSIHKRDRPKSRPRAGSLIERFFRTTREAFINNLMGNTQAQQQWRKVSPEVDPARFAIWTYEKLELKLEEFFERVYHQNHHTTLGCSPHYQFLNGLTQSGERLHCRISYTEDFILQTLPSTSKGTAKITVRGVKINYLYYNSTALSDLSIHKQIVPVRYDPFNAGYAYAFVNHRWEKIISEYESIFKSYSTHVIFLMSKYLRIKYRSADSAKEINAQRLAEFLQSAEAEEVIGMQQLHDDEATKSRQKLSTSHSVIGTQTVVGDELKGMVEQESANEEYLAQRLEEF